MLYSKSWADSIQEQLEVEMKIRYVAAIVVLGLTLSGCSGGNSSEDAINQINADSAKISQDNLKQNDNFASEVVLAGFSTDLQAMKDLASNVEFEAFVFLTNEEKKKLSVLAGITTVHELKTALLEVGLSSDRGLDFLEDAEIRPKLQQAALSIGNGGKDAEHAGNLLGQLAGITTSTEETTLKSLREQFMWNGALEGAKFEFNDKGDLTRESFVVILTKVSLAYPLN